MSTDSLEMPLVEPNKKYTKYGNGDSPAASKLVAEIGESLSAKLVRRKRLLLRGRLLVSLQFFMAMSGVIFMVVETELYTSGYLGKDSLISFGLKSAITGTTLVLLLATCGCYVTTISVRLLDNGLQDWRLVITAGTWLQLFAELGICAIHPLPGVIMVNYVSVNGQTREVPLDAVLSILMILRMYLIVKFFVAHNRLLTDTSTQSIGALSKVKINTMFVFKATMTTSPGLVIISLMLVIFVANTWAYRTCEVYYLHEEDPSNYLNAMWLVAITFLTVGYGDITPHTYCGRLVSVLTGITGVGTTALLVAMMAQKLEQTRAERYVFNFIYRLQKDSVRKNAAANILKSTIRLWKMKKHGGYSKNQISQCHGKLIQAIRTMKMAKSEMATIAESSIGIIEISKEINDVSNIVTDSSREQVKIKEAVADLQTKVTSINEKMNEIVALLSKSSK